MPDPNPACERCGSPLKSGKRFCSVACRNKTIKTRRAGPDAPNWKGGIQTYRQYRRDACERCGATEKLVVHHKNENRYDNRLENLETLCRRCHQVHHRCADNLPTGPRPKRIEPAKACESCGTMFVPKVRYDGGRHTTRFCARQCWLTFRLASGAERPEPTPS